MKATRQRSKRFIDSELRKNVFDEVVEDEVENSV